MHKVSARLHPDLGKALEEHLQANPHICPTAVVVAALEQYLSVPPVQQDIDVVALVRQMQTRINALEAAVNELQALSNPLPDQSITQLMADERDGITRQSDAGLFDSELASVLGCSLSNIRNRARLMDVGSTYRGYVIADKITGPAGGHPRRVWKPLS